MTNGIRVAMPAALRTLLEPRIPPGATPVWISDVEQGLSACADVEVGWFDLPAKADISRLAQAAVAMRWFNTQFVGLDQLPVEIFKRRATTVTNGSGVVSVAVAEYVLMAILVVAKGYREVVRAQDKHEWLGVAPGRMELDGTRALVLGLGATGRAVVKRLEPFGVTVCTVRRTPDSRSLGPEEWRSHLSEFDWVVLAVPATGDTIGMIGKRELLSMKRSAVLINVARGNVIDQDALTIALKEQRIGAAFLDVTEPEPLPADHALWQLPNAHISMHLSGRSQSSRSRKSADAFIANLQRYISGEPLTNRVDLVRGY